MVGRSRETESSSMLSSGRGKSGMDLGGGVAVVILPRSKLTTADGSGYSVELEKQASFRVESNVDSSSVFSTFITLGKVVMWPT